MTNAELKKAMFYEERLNSILLRIRIMPNVKGYPILKDSVLQVSMDGSKKYNMNKSLYPMLAKTYNVTVGQIERRLKILCDNCKKVCGQKDLSCVFGGQNVQDISVKQIICLLAERLNLEYRAMLYTQNQFNFA